MGRPDIPRYDLVTELLVASLARQVDVEPDQFRAWTRGVEEPPEWFSRAIQEMLEPALPTGETRRLTSREEPSTLRTVKQSESSNVQRSRALMSDEARKTKAGRHAIENGFSFVELSDYLSRELGREVAHATVRSWFRSKDSPSYRIIPLDAQKALAKKPYAVPRDVWPQVRGE